MIDLACHCGTIRISVARQPDFINQCNCSLCRKAGAKWGYFDPDEVAVSGASRQYRRCDKAEPAVEIHFCAQCGSTTHFTLTQAAVAKYGSHHAGVNMALAEPGELVGVELRFPDGASWSGAGEFAYVRPPHRL